MVGKGMFMDLGVGVEELASFSAYCAHRVKNRRQS